MKELSIEEKSKLYDEAYKKVAIRFGSNVADEIFSQFEMSEDEKIRKALINVFATHKDYEMFFGVSVEDILAWLEKQGTSYTKKDIEDAYLKGVTDTKNEIEKQYEANYQIRKDIATFIFNYKGDIKDRAKWIDYLCIKVSFVEKQGEQKPNPCDGCTNRKGCINCENGELRETEQKSLDKVEPKFHEGEWITNGDYTWQIVSVTDLDYILQSQDGNTVDDTISHVDEQFHSFTIEDAKDGDVLCYKDEISLYKHDIKNCTKQGTTFGGFVCHCCYDGKRFVVDSLYSLTEQDKMDILPATKEQRDLLFQKMKEAGYEWDTDIKELKRIEQRPAWSEEDEKCLENAIMYCEWARDKAPDEHCYNTRTKSIDWLKSLKERVQPKQEWSEEDWNYIADLISYFDGSSLQHDTPDVISWLKSLRPQNTWKPSDEQMEILDMVLTNESMDDNIARILRELREQLKKLREE